MRSRAVVSLLVAVGCTAISGDGMPLLETLPVPSVSGCPPLDLQRVGSVDVVIVIDRSRSTIDSTGRDINQNGKIGRPIISPVGSIFDVGSTDTGDSLLAAQVVATRSILEALLNDHTRFGIVSFAGPIPNDPLTPTLHSAVGAPLSEHLSALRL